MPQRLLTALLATVLLWSGAPAQAFDLQGHRGARGLAPENTLAAFERALAEGVTTLELDVGLSADDVPAVLHDLALPPDMARGADGRWLTAPTPLLRRLTLAELQAYDVGRARPGSATARAFPEQRPQDGQRMPTLAELFARMQALGAAEVRFNIETKLDPTRPHDSAPPAAFVDAILQVVRAAGMQRRVTIQSFDWRTLQRVQQVAPELPTAYLTVRGERFDNLADGSWTAGLRLADHASVAHLVKAAGGAIWSPLHTNLDLPTLRQAQALGLKVIPWTVNQPADMARLIDWGVDGLITDYPDRARAVLRERGLPLPPVLAR